MSAFASDRTLRPFQPINGTQVELDLLDVLDKVEFPNDRAEKLLRREKKYRTVSNLHGICVNKKNRNDLGKKREVPKKKPTVIDYSFFFATRWPYVAFRSAYRPKAALRNLKSTKTFQLPETTSPKKTRKVEGSRSITSTKIHKSSKN